MSKSFITVQAASLNEQDLKFSVTKGAKNV